MAPPRDLTALSASLNLDTEIGPCRPAQVHRDQHFLDQAQDCALASRPCDANHRKASVEHAVALP